MQEKLEKAFTIYSNSAEPLLQDVNDDDKRSYYEGANLLLVATCKMDVRGILSGFAFIF